ncbi:hypothetical protein BX661DRAFT_184366 [Kickxella alabastrina]|uniref:uncharacterized protein n=1 Tax=Kickxella alabastrina TaxID=61397 RepID=UPI00221ED604|nr:uncharacterized protein BX661DRAFT_184366 [Kickxella alabastrina]KAI7825902.1 hypothetical protein BX661DRAFT_184366 [Kickxella alabastrina]
MLFIIQLRKLSALLLTAQLHPQWRALHSCFSNFCKTHKYFSLYFSPSCPPATTIHANIYYDKHYPHYYKLKTSLEPSF